jgi:aspartokinase
VSKLIVILKLRRLTFILYLVQSYFGANVLHPRTISPVIQYGIPIIIWNIFDTSASGTNICHPSIIENEDRKIFKNLCLGLYNDKQFGTCKCGRVSHTDVLYEQ